MQGPHATEIRPGKVEIQDRKGQLRRDDETDQEPGDAPEHGSHGAEFDRPHVVVRFTVDFLRDRHPIVIEVTFEDDEHADRGNQCP